MLLLCLFAVVLSFSATPIFAKWNLFHEEKTGQYVVHSDEIEVSDVQNHIARTQMVVWYYCSTKKPEEGLSLFFNDVPPFSNADIVETEKTRSFDIMTFLFRKGLKEPKVEVKKVIQPKRLPNTIYLDSDFIYIMRKYDLFRVGFGWKHPKNNRGVISDVSLAGFGAHIDEAQRKCDMARR